MAALEQRVTDLETASKNAVSKQDLAAIEERLTQRIDALATRFDAKVDHIIVLLERGTGVTY